MCVFPVFGFGGGGGGLLGFPVFGQGHNFASSSLVPEVTAGDHQQPPSSTPGSYTGFGAAGGTDGGGASDSEEEVDAEPDDEAAESEEAAEPEEAESEESEYSKEVRLQAEAAEAWAAQHHGDPFLPRDQVLNNLIRQAEADGEAEIVEELTAELNQLTAAAAAAAAAAAEEEDDNLENWTQLIANEHGDFIDEVQHDGMMHMVFTVPATATNERWQLAWCADTRCWHRIYLNGLAWHQMPGNANFRYQENNEEMYIQEAAESEALD